MDIVVLSTEHLNTPFLRFTDILRSRQDNVDADVDIRSWVLDRRWQKVGIGLTEDVLGDKFGANLGALFPNNVPVDSEAIKDCAWYLVHGTVRENSDTSHKGASRLLGVVPDGAELCFMETGFLATTHSWAHSAKEHDPRYACLGYVYDDIAHYFMADYPNRLIRKLNSSSELSDAERSRAQALIDRIVSRRITKYNAQPMSPPPVSDASVRRVLVCDQAYQDASTHYGRVDDASFEAMLQAAIDENPDAEILVKTHPDSTWKSGERTGYYSHLDDHDRVRILRAPVNPFAMFDLVDKVYVGTSQMGLEALFAGKDVVVFGAPFYAGWGLTDDRQPIPHRGRERNLTDVFHYFYDWYTIYHVPGCTIPSSIEDALDHIEAHRPFRAPFGREILEKTPRVSVIIPVHGVEKFIEKCIRSVQQQTLLEIEIIPVNDASPDDSQTIIDTLAADDPRIRPITLDQNIGQGFARNKALEAARGDYVWFLDGDDWLVDPRFLSEVVTAADQNSADMTRAKKAGEAVFDADGTTLLRIDQDKSEAFFTAPVARTTFADDQNLLHSRHFCLWLYRRKFLRKNEIRFATTQWEERAFLLRALLTAQTISQTTSTSFMYRIRRNSTARRGKNLTDCENFLQNFEQVGKLLKSHGAHHRDSALRPHLNFQISQFLNYLFYGFFFRTLRKEIGDLTPYLDRIAEVLEDVDFGSRDFTGAPIGVHKDLFEIGGYQLLVAALVARRFDLALRAADAKPILQEDYLQILQTKPSMGKESDLQFALNKYARNERVLTKTNLSKQGATDEPKPRMIIHIGSTKAGSTALQSFFDLNRPEMLRRGIYYPEVGIFSQEGRPHKQAGHADFAAEATNKGTQLKEHVEAAIALSDGKINTVVLSSEAFFLNENSVDLASHFPNFDIEMVVYLRRQDDWLNSQYAEFVAGGAVGRVDSSIETWLKDARTVKRMDYLNCIKPWQRALGKDSIHVGVYEKDKLHNGDIVSDFLRLVNIDGLDDLPRPPRATANHFVYGNAHVEIMRHFNSAHWKTQAQYFAFVDEVDRGISEIRAARNLPRPALNLLNIDARQEILDHVRASNAQIAREFLGRADGVLFAAGHDLESPEDTPLTNEELRFMLATFERHQSPAKRADARNRFYQRKGYVIRSSAVFRMYKRLSSSSLNRMKAQKLDRDPERFFRDSRSVFLKAVFWLIKCENAVTLAGQSIEGEGIRDTIVFRLINRFGAKLGRQKLTKLNNDPAAFFADMRSPAAGLLRWILKLELILRR